MPLQIQTVTRMDPFRVYEMYVSLKTHFSTQKYDYFKFHGKVRVTEAMFDARKDKYFFRKLSQKFNEEELEQFFVANFLYNEEVWVGDIIGERGFAVYNKWRKRVEGLTYLFEQDLCTIRDTMSEEKMTLNGVLAVEKGKLPRIITMMLQADISIETLTLFCVCLKLLPKWDKMIDEDLLWPQIRLKCEKYAPFLPVKDTTKFLKMIAKKFHSPSQA